MAVGEIVWPERYHHLGDFEVGRRFHHRWGRTLLLSDSMTFSMMTMAYTPLYFDREVAKAAGHPGIPINPALVFATVLGLTVEDLSEGGGPFLGLDDVAYGSYCYDGDTVTATSEVLEARPSTSRPGFGVATWRTTGVNQRGEEVVSYTRANLVRDGR